MQCPCAYSKRQSTARLTLSARRSCVLSHIDTCMRSTVGGKATIVYSWRGQNKTQLSRISVHISCAHARQARRDVQLPSDMLWRCSAIHLLHAADCRSNSSVDITCIRSSNYLSIHPIVPMSERCVRDN